MLILLYLFNPIATSLRSIQQASELKKVQKKLVTRWQKNYNMVGFGHLYQGRFKSFPVETDHLGKSEFTVD